jgi:dienelactone hydrolase
MANVIVFHHALGLTPGIRAFAGRLEQAGHTVHLPDLFEGRRFDDLAAGVAFAEQTGFGVILERGRAAAGALPHDLVYVGFSLGVMPAQTLAQTRGGARGAVLVDACVPVGEFGGVWPAGVPVQIHAMDADPWFTESGDLQAAETLVAATDKTELFLYAGDRHPFADESLASFDPAAAALFEARVQSFIGAV